MIASYYFVSNYTGSMFQKISISIVIISNVPNLLQKVIVLGFQQLPILLPLSFLDLQPVSVDSLLVEFALEVLLPFYALLVLTGGESSGGVQALLMGQDGVALGGLLIDREVLSGRMQGLGFCV